MNLTDLPRELLHHTLGFLTLPAILPLGATARAFHDVVVQEVSNRQRKAAKLRYQTFCYHLFAPIDRFGVPLVRCTALTDRQQQSSIYNEQRQQRHTHHTTTLTPRIECKTVIVQQSESSLAKNIKCIQSERRVRLDDEVRFAQLIYKFEIIQYSNPLDDNGSTVGGLPRCSGSSIVAEGVVRVFRSWLDDSLERQSHTPGVLGRLALPVDEALFKSSHLDLNRSHKRKRMKEEEMENMLVLRTSIRAGAWNEHSGDKTYYVRVHDVEIDSTFLVIKSEQAEISGAKRDAAAHEVVSTAAIVAS